jgi:hypothetical protein
MLVFLAISANMVNFILCENLESAHLGGESPEAEVNANKQRSLDGANEMRMLLPVLGQLNQFEVRLQIDQQQFTFCSQLTSYERPIPSRQSHSSLWLDTACHIWV